MSRGFVLAIACVALMASTASAAPTSLMKGMWSLGEDHIDGTADDRRAAGVQVEVPQHRPDRLPDETTAERADARPERPTPAAPAAQQPDGDRQ